MTLQKFDIDFVTSHFGTCDLDHYLSVIKTASSPELRALRAEIIAHKITHRSHVAFSNTLGLTSHDALICAIDYSLLTRSQFRHKIWSTVMPARQWLVKTFSGLVLSRDDNFGAIYTHPIHRRNLLHMTHLELGRILGFFAANHWKFLITSGIAIAAIAAKLLAS